MKTTQLALSLIAATVTPFQLAELQDDQNWTCADKVDPNDMMIKFEGPTSVNYKLQDHHLMVPRH